MKRGVGISIVLLAFVIIASACTVASFARDLAATRARLFGRSKTIETSLGTLEYAAIGEGEPILTIHGAAGGFDQGIDLTGAMAGQG
jgi:2-hydroxy-6-oxonona-2,4-dienedioate hydrolase